MFQKKVLVISCLLAGLVLGLINLSTARDKNIKICSLVSREQLSQLYKKKLYPKEYMDQCFWSKKPDGMAYFDIQYHEYQKPLREYFNKELSDTVSLEKITDLGDDGLMTVVDGSLGAVVIRKGDWVLQSAVTFLEIKPGSHKQKVLWDIYREIIERL